MHVDLTPDVTIADAQKSLLALAGYLRGQPLDAGCTMKACGVVLCYSANFAPHDKPIMMSNSKEDQACTLKAAADDLAMQAAPDPAKKIDWGKVLQIVVTILSLFAK